MDNNFDNYHYHQWRPGPTQPNLCPICMSPHFPFCPPYPPPSLPRNPPIHPPYLHLPRPGFEFFNGPPIRPHNHYPVGDQRPWQAHHSWRPVSDYRSGADGNIEADRSYKRARIDPSGGGSPGYGVSVSDCYQSSQISWENERRLKIVQDHGHRLSAGNPDAYNVENSVVAGFGDRRSFSANELNQYGRSDFRTEGQYNGLAPPPPHPPLPPASYGGYFGGPNGQPPLPVSPPPPPPPSQPSLFPVTTKSSAVIPPSSYSQMPNAPPSSAKSASSRSKVVDVSHLLKPPHRSTRPDHFVIILRGLPGCLLSLFYAFCVDL